MRGFDSLHPLHATISFHIIIPPWIGRFDAALAQLVERVLGKDEVLGSNPKGSSNLLPHPDSPALPR